VSETGISAAPGPSSGFSAATGAGTGRRPWPGVPAIAAGLGLLVVLVIAAGLIVPGHRSREAMPLWPGRVGQTGTSTCTDPVARQQWRVSWTVLTGIVIRPTAFAVRSLPDGGWRPQDTELWSMRYNQVLSQARFGGITSGLAHTGTLATLVQSPIEADMSPRYVTPDGACTVYVAPFGPGPAGKGAVAVLGDSLVGQLARVDEYLPPRAGPLAELGPLASRIRAIGDRSEVDGQSGRRWIRIPSSATALFQADQSMLDELRGLRDAGAVVVALGTNDAGWVALAPDQREYRDRLTLVLGQLRSILDELQGQGGCTVLVTMAGRGKEYYGSQAGRFSRAADRIDALLRDRAAADPHRRLRLSDWAAQADPHGRDDADPWFGSDSIHLNPTGVETYATALTQAATLC
jgi:lysophospholipase L1-like esterase